MTNLSRNRKAPTKLKSMGDHDEFLNRITKSLYYSKLPMTDCLSLPVTELAAELFTEVKSGHTLERLDVEEASRISRNACVSPCSLVLALLYLERLKDCNPEYLQRVAPSELFLVSLMVASKFLHDDGEDDEVFNTEWAHSGDLPVSYMNQLEKDFLKAIDWTIFVYNHDFWERLQKLERDIAYKEAQKRGWFSYTELSCLMNSMQLVTVAHVIINISSICLAAYTAGVITLLGSTLIASYLPGTFLSPSQSTNSTEIKKTELSSINEAVSINIDSVSDEVLTVNFDLDSLKCNETCENCQGTESEDDVVDMSWKWWLNSVMTWLPKYSGLGSQTNIDTKAIKFIHTGSFVTNTELLFDTTSSIHETDDLITDVSWKEILGLDVKFPSHDWRLYANYVAKITLSYRH